ncbi:GNAT family N-acetyltransferase [Salinibius halmophilus]|uniref:GNAT family N-acetyltransferase n=1 Tax=Salinibius halmophilus TaxID=1853216 RepID=UPI000E6723EC|nr:GNAT family protein [Salinibius halmophilus]
MFTLATKNLVLRDFQPADVAAYQVFTGERKYQRFYSEEDCEPAKAEMLVHLFSDSTKVRPRSMYQMAITLKDTGELMGTVGVRLEDHRQASMGAGVARAFHGKGYAQEAGQAMLDFAFNELGVHRVYAETISKNRAAIMLCKQLGMVEEGRFVEHKFFKNQWWDTVIMATRQP